ncbi:MAG: hypothetical protein ACP5O7_13020 [Phycisphaerae bacterium]
MHRFARRSGYVALGRSTVEKIDSPTSAATATAVIQASTSAATEAGPDIVSVSFAGGVGEQAPSTQPGERQTPVRNPNQAEAGSTRDAQAAARSVSGMKTFSLVLGEIGCLMLVAALWFLPAPTTSGLWTHSARALQQLSPTLPNFLRAIELIGGLAGLVLIPLMPAARRGKYQLRFGLFMLALLGIALLQQYQIGFYLVFLPTLGLLSVMIADAIVRVRPSQGGSASLRRWQLAAGCVTTAVWLVPAYAAITGSHFAGLFAVAHGGRLQTMFRVGCIAGEAVGLLTLLGCAVQFTGMIKNVTRVLSVSAVMLAFAVGFLMSTAISGVLRGDRGWFGIELVWLLFLVVGSLLLVWGGFALRLSVFAADNRGEAGVTM